MLPGYALPVPRDNTELFTLIGIGVGTFFLLLLFISTFLRWVSGGDLGRGLSGTFFGDGRLILLFSLVFRVFPPGGILNAGRMTFPNSVPKSDHCGPPATLSVMAIAVKAIRTLPAGAATWSMKKATAGRRA